MERVRSDFSLPFVKHPLNIKSHWRNLVPRINVENTCIQQISFYVFLYIHAVGRHVTLVVWVHYYKRTVENNEERK
jgi:hypothetical protein